MVQIFGDACTKGASSITQSVIDSAVAMGVCSTSLSDCYEWNVQVGSSAKLNPSVWLYAAVAVLVAVMYKAF